MIIGIVGLGLMGASAGRLMMSKGHTVYGADIDDAVVKKAILVKAIERPLTYENASDIDMLIVATYPRLFKEIVERYAPHMKDGAIVSDFCGNKRSVLEDMRALSSRYPRLVYIGAHPMAGREYWGINHSSVRMFEGASIILVPESYDIHLLASVKEFYLSLGFGRVEITDADNHDAMIAYTSQLCHIVSNAYIKSDSALKHTGYSAGSYRDLTRVARLNADMWSQLMIDNKDKLTDELKTLIDNLNRYLTALQNGDEEGLKELLAEGNARKNAIDKR